MNQMNILKNYTLSQYSIEKLKMIKEKLKEDVTDVDPLWNIVIDKVEEVYMNAEDIMNEDDKCDNSLSKFDYTQLSMTQFHFTQHNNFDKGMKQVSVQKLDIIECLLEDLEHPSGKLDLSQLENLLDKEFEEVVCHLENKLSIMGTYNLCNAMNCMTLEQRIKYATVFHSHLLLPKIIALEEPSRLLLSVITECVQKFPDDIQKLIFIPLLNVDLKDTSVINAIVNAYESQKNILLMEYLSHAKELKSWHLPILYNLVPVKTDATTNDKLIELLSAKALDFAADKTFGKLVLSFIKVKENFSEQQKCLLWEIANVHQSLFKKPIQNILKII